MIRKKEKIIAQGAEALLIKKNGILLKKRIKKSYRHSQLDLLLRASRIRKEARLLKKLAQVIPVPKIKAVDGMVKKPLGIETEIEMEFIQGKLLSQWLDKFSLADALKVCEKIGKNMALIHDLDIIHGDLTTSNVILKDRKEKKGKKGKQIYFIDFGLGFHSTRAEDKAVDLHLLREALEAKHFERWQDYFKAVLKGYKNSKNAVFVIERLKKVEARGRYKGKGKAKGKKKLLIP